MRQMQSGIKTTEIDPNRKREVSELARKTLAAQRDKTVPTIGLVSNFDPDMRGFLTGPYQGFTSIQIGASGGSGFYGTLAVQTDYTPLITKDQANALSMTPAQREQANQKRVLPLPGHPTLVYPAASTGPAINTNFIRGGKAANLDRAYPVKKLTKAWTTYTFGDTSDPGLHITYLPDACVVIRDDVDFMSIIADNWDQNSPLPPGVRYYELVDLFAMTQQGIGALPIAPGQPAPLGVSVSGSLMTILHVDDLSILLPHDSLGNIRTNLVPLPDEAWWHLSEVYKDDNYWKGEVRDPVTWLEVDSYWQSRGITTEALAAYLTAHPGCRY